MWQKMTKLGVKTKMAVKNFLNDLMVKKEEQVERKMLKKVFAMVGALDLDENLFWIYVADRFNIQSRKELTEKQLKKIIDALEKAENDPIALMDLSNKITPDRIQLPDDLDVEAEEKTEEAKQDEETDPPLESNTPDLGQNSEKSYSMAPIRLDPGEDVKPLPDEKMDEVEYAPLTQDDVAEGRYLLVLRDDWKAGDYPKDRYVTVCRKAKAFLENIDNRLVNSDFSEMDEMLGFYDGCCAQARDDAFSQNVIFTRDGRWYSRFTVMDRKDLPEALEPEDKPMSRSQWNQWTEEAENNPHIAISCPDGYIFDDGSVYKENRTEQEEIFAIEVGRYPDPNEKWFMAQNGLKEAIKYATYHGLDEESFNQAPF